MATPSLEGQKIVTLLSFILALITSFYYLGGQGVAGGHQADSFHLESTPFSANFVFLLLFWCAEYLAQIAFLHQLFYGTDDAKKDSLLVTNYLSTFNVLHFVWTVLLAHQHFVIAEIAVALNFLLIGALYWSGRTQHLEPPLRYFTIHYSVSALPFAWALFTLFWTGAIAVHSHDLFGRIVANIFIWIFFVVPSGALIVFADWGFAYASAFLTWGIAVQQILVKVIALQWIFAIVIALVITVEAGVTMFTSGFRGLWHRSPGSAQDMLDRVMPVANEETPLVG
ncbi:uncharacterized protein V1518DRAFT_408537 [Limtongia smithiae]|uniref:uncharacterized protein n=1 Tax=Limtongia smithiae TaxID=1125753 RepID=UPI0034CE65CF